MNDDCNSMNGNASTYRHEAIFPTLIDCEMKMQVQQEHTFDIDYIRAGLIVRVNELQASKLNIESS